jgi:carboxyl-terminal processing protease
VQNVIPLVDFSSAKVTIAKYFLPSGRDIGRKVDEDGEYLSGGLRPDIVVPVDESGEFIFADPVKDNQLKKAIEVIESKRG